MSKPPSKSGGAGRGRPPQGPSGGGSSRDRSSFGESRSGGFRNDSPRGGPARGAGPREDAPRGGDGSRYNSGGSRGAARSGGPRDNFRRDDAPRGKIGRDEAARRDGPRPPRRDDRPRADGPRDAPARDGAFRTGPRDSAPRGKYSRDDLPRGGSRDGAPRATYSRGPARDSRFGDDRRDNRYGDDRRDNRYGRNEPSRGPRPISNPGPAPRAAAPTPKNPALPAREGERIAKLLARAGVASRREVERMIIEGRVRLGDDLIETPSTVLTSLAGVTVDGNPVAEAEGTRLFLFHKPAGLITAERDPAGRPTIYNALRNALPDGAGRVMPIGRLDLNTEGLLLLTNDGEFKRQLELPATGVPRTYRARTFGDITQSRLEELMEGIEVDGVIYGKINANMERRTGRNQWIEMTLTEGKNREVRRVLEALDLQVSRLLRVSYGPFRLGDLPKGAAGEVAQKDLENFRRSLREGKASGGLA